MPTWSLGGNSNQRSECGPGLSSGHLGMAQRAQKLLLHLSRPRVGIAMTPVLQIPPTRLARPPRP